MPEMTRFLQLAGLKSWPFIWTHAERTWAQECRVRPWWCKHKPPVICLMLDCPVLRLHTPQGLNPAPTSHFCTRSPPHPPSLSPSSGSDISSEEKYCSASFTPSKAVLTPNKSKRWEHTSGRGSRVQAGIRELWFWQPLPPFHKRRVCTQHWIKSQTRPPFES